MTLLFPFLSQIDSPNSEIPFADRTWNASFHSFTTSIVAKGTNVSIGMETSSLETGPYERSPSILVQSRNFLLRIYDIRIGETSSRERIDEHAASDRLADSSSVEVEGVAGTKRNGVFKAVKRARVRKRNHRRRRGGARVCTKVD